MAALSDSAHKILLVFCKPWLIQCLGKVQHALAIGELYFYAHTYSVRNNISVY